MYVCSIQYKKKKELKEQNLRLTIYYVLFLFF